MSKKRNQTAPLPTEIKAKGQRSKKDSYELTEIVSDSHQTVPLYLDMALQAMEDLTYFVKVRSKSWQKTRGLLLSPDHLSLIITKKSCLSNSSKILDMKKIVEIRRGHQSAVWDTLGSKRPAEDQCFSLMFEDRTEPLNLVAINKEQAKMWITGITHLNSNLDKLDVEEEQMIWIWEHFKTADKDSSNLLSYKEIKKLLEKLNFEASSTYIKKILQDCDVSGDGSLSFSEFTEFFRKISWRPEVERLYKTYCDADLKLSAQELRRFFQEDQNELELTEEDALNLIIKFEPDEAFKNDKKMSIYGFTYMLLSPYGDIFNYKHRKVFMDMTKPLSHYFIASSHNTYLTEDQLFGKSSVECYIRAFEKGCRCVELDCWDGDNGEPIIYHGYTLTSKIRFADVIEAVRDYAFKSSDYPVILSIENHCSVPQQNKMAAILKDTLGDRLLTKALGDDAYLPSPKSLKGKVLVKGKTLPSTSSGVDDEGEVSDEDEAADVEENGEKKRPQKTSKKIKLSRDLSNCVVYAKSRHFKGFDDAKSNSGSEHISSLNEDKTESLISTQPEYFVEHSEWQLVRIYPRGARTNSSNYNPLPMWNAGCQIVALNYQTEGTEMYLNHSKFKTNGGCGYILKPRCLLEKGFNPKNVCRKAPGVSPVTFSIRIISAQQLPKPTTSKSSDVIDPYVVVSVVGCDVDCKTLKTSVVSDNGFNPTWVNEKPLEFEILVPGLAFLEVSVFDKDTYGDDDLVGTYTVPVESVSPGYRHIHLETHAASAINPATLFVNTKISAI